VGGVTRRAAVAAGSNLGDRTAALAFAAARLGGILSNLRVSDPIDTAHQGPGRGTEPDYLNAVMVGETSLSARDLLRHLLAIEQEHGRERSYPGAPRTLDLDLVLLGEDVVDEPDLHVPHPRFRERDFVLAPLAQLAPDMRDPVTKLTVKEIWERKKEEGRRRKDEGRRGEEGRK
jgi:2-amino-4-hydroxy-6-hydroxymethyldihydropteridine diphosphokinase